MAAHSIRIPQTLLGRVRDFLDSVRAQAAAEKEAKRLAREADQEARKQRAIEREKPSTKHRDAVESVRNGLLQRNAVAIRTLKAALVQVEQANTALVQAEFPDLPQEIDDLPLLSKLQTEVDILKNAAAEEKRAYATLEERIDQLAEQVQTERKRRQTFAAAVVAAISDPNILKLAASIPTLKDQAKAEIEEAKKAP